MPTRLKKPIVVSDTPISASQKDRVEAVSASGSPLENPINRIATSRGCPYTAIEAIQSRPYRRPGALASAAFIASVQRMTLGANPLCFAGKTTLSFRGGAKRRARNP